MVARREARLHQAKPAGVLELNAVHVAKKIDDGLRTGEQREIARDDDALETVVYKSQQAGEPLVESFDRPSSPA